MSKIAKKMTIALVSFLISFGFLTNLNNKSYITEINVSGNTIVIDITKSPTHTEFVNFDGNLTDALNTVNIESTNLDLPIIADALFISQPSDNYSTLEMTNIMNFLQSGNKSLFIGGDADFGGYNATHTNILLEFLGSKIRLDSSQIIDSVYNDGMDYRVAAMNYSSGIIGTNVSQNCIAGIIMHGACAILGYEDSSTVDLRNNTIEGVEVLLSYSESSTAANIDGSDTEYDIYSKDSVDESGDYPAVVCETLLFDGKKSYIILAGEVIFSDYKRMYDQYTSNGVYNGGIHYGQMFVNNLINYFLDDSNYIIIDEFSKIPILSFLTFVPIVACFVVIIKKKKSMK